MTATQIEKPELIIIEDDMASALEYSNHIKIGNEVKETFLTEISNVSELVVNNDKDGELSFLIDCNLGNGKEEDGLKAVKIIREKHPNDLIIVYSSNSLKEEAKLKGADFFIQKNPAKYERDVLDIKNILISSINREKINTISNNLKDDYEVFFKKRNSAILPNNYTKKIVNDNTNTEFRLSVFEDELEQTQNFLSHLNLGSDFKETTLTHVEQISHVLNEDEKQFFWIDINHGREREKEGIDAIAEIKKRQTASPVIAYSAYDVKDEAKGAGADFFFRKNADDYPADIEKIRSIIEGIKNNKTLEELPVSLEGDHRSDYKTYCENHLEQFWNKKEKTNASLRLKIKNMEGEANIAGYLYLSKKILSTRDSSDTLWVAGNQVWEVEYEKDASIIKSSPQTSNNNIPYYEITFNVETEKPTLLTIVNDEQVDIWNLNNIEKVDEKISTVFNYDFSQLSTHDLVFYNVIIAQVCARELIKKNGNKKLARSLASRLDDAIGKLEVLKWLAIYYAEDLNLPKKQIKEKLHKWVKTNSFPEIIELFHGRLIKVKRGKKIGIVELKSVFSGKRTREEFNYSKLTDNHITQKEDCFLLTAYKPRQGSYASDIEPQDYKSTA